MSYWIGVLFDFEWIFEPVLI